MLPLSLWPIRMPIGPRETCTKKGEVVTVRVPSLNPQTGTCSEKLKWQVTVDMSPINTGDLPAHHRRRIGKIDNPGGKEGHHTPRGCNRQQQSGSE